MGADLAAEVVAQVILETRGDLGLADDSDAILFKVGLYPVVGAVEILALLRDEVADGLQGDFGIGNVESLPIVAEGLKTIQGGNADAVPPQVR